MRSSAEWARRAASSRTIEEMVAEVPLKALPIEDRDREAKEHLTGLEVVKLSCRDADVQTEVVDAMASEVLAAKSPSPEKLAIVFSSAGMAHSVLMGLS